MKKAGTALCLLAFTAFLAGCNNFFHELIPPGGDRIVSFRVEGQQGDAAIAENSVSLMVDRGTDLTALIPVITVSPRASILPLSLPYIAAAFPSQNILEAAIGLYSAEDLSAYAMALIRENPDFTVPPLDKAVDFSGPADFLVVGGRGSIRRYTVRAAVDARAAQILRFGFSKADNPLLTGDALGILNEGTKTIQMLAVFPVEMDPVYSLIPSFEILGEVLEADGAPVTPGVSPLAFTGPLNTTSGSLQTKTLTVRRAGYPDSEYTLTLAAGEDPDTIRSITDFRFTQADNPGIAAAATASIINNDNLGTIRVQVLYRGSRPAALTARFVSPGRVTVEGALQTTGVTVNDFSGPLEYRVVSRNGLYTRLYTVETEFISASDAAPRMLSFRFPADINGELAQTAAGEISDAAGLILVDAKYAGAVPRSLIPEFSASGPVKVSGLTQTSGASAQDFSRQVKYTVYSPDYPNIYRDYWVQARFIRDASADAAITAFSFHPDENPRLSAEVTARIDQVTGQISAWLPLGTNLGGGPLVPRFTSYGKVFAEGVMQASGSSGHLFDRDIVYEAVSANGMNRKTYTVTVLQEVNSRIYVNQNAYGRNNGLSWQDAFISLGAACEAAASLPPDIPKEVWIAAGTYRPSETGDTSAYFPISSNTSYIGGFAGRESGENQRNPAANPVTVSGDLGGGRRSRQLFKNAAAVKGDIVFKDLSFTGARGTAAADHGPGIHLEVSGDLSGRAELRNCAFTDLQTVGYGGAVYILYPEIAADGVMITNTKAGKNGGGALMHSSHGPVSIENVKIENAEAAGDGGGLYVVSNGSMTQTVISGLSVKKAAAGLWGGGAIIDVAEPLRLENIKIEDTQAYNGAGGLYVRNKAMVQTVISGLTIINGQAEGDDGKGAWIRIQGGGVLSVSEAIVNGISRTGDYLFDCRWP
jgi:hypothetical protein